jgi:hypothetical protein
MNKSPAAIVKEKFGDKAKLVAALGPFTQDDLWLARANTKKGLERVSNAKLLRLHQVFSEVKEKFGTRLKLVDAIADLEKRTKDEGYKKRLLAYPVPRLYDLYRSVTKRSRAEAPAKASLPKEGRSKPQGAAPKTTASAPRAAARPKVEAAAGLERVSEQAAAGSKGSSAAAAPTAEPSPKGGAKKAAPAPKARTAK